MAKNRDMRQKQNKQHLGTASNRDAYEQQKSVLISDNSNATASKPPVKKPTE